MPRRHQKREVDPRDIAFLVLLEGDRYLIHPPADWPQAVREAVLEIAQRRAREAQVRGHEFEPDVWYVVQTDLLPAEVAAYVREQGTALVQAYWTTERVAEYVEGAQRAICYRLPIPMGYG